MTPDPRSRLIALLLRLDAPDLAAQLWTVRDVRELSRDVREATADVLGHESGARGLDADDELNAYGRDLEGVIRALGLDEEG